MGVRSCAWPILEVGGVHVGVASLPSTPLPVHSCPAAPLERNLALMAASASTAADSAMGAWTVQTSRMNWAVSLKSCQVCVYQDVHEMLQQKNLFYCITNIPPPPRLPSGPNTNSTSGWRFREKYAPEVSSSPHANSRKNSLLPDSLSCAAQRCNGHGTCVTEGASVGCVCTDGYRGEFCQHGGRQRSHAPTFLAVLFLLVLLMAAAFIFIKRCRRQTCCCLF